MAGLAARSTVGTSSRASTILTNSSTPFAARRSARWRITCAKGSERQESDTGQRLHFSEEPKDQPSGSRQFLASPFFGRASRGQVVNYC